MLRKVFQRGKKFHFSMTFNACSGFFRLYIYPHECVCTKVLFISDVYDLLRWNSRKAIKDDFDGKVKIFKRRT
jgi:hypothetical protein